MAGARVAGVWGLCGALDPIGVRGLVCRCLPTEAGMVLSTAIEASGCVLPSGVAACCVAQSMGQLDKLLFDVWRKMQALDIPCYCLPCWVLSAGDGVLDLHRAGPRCTLPHDEEHARQGTAKVPEAML